MKRTPIILFLFALNTLNTAATKKEKTGLQALITDSQKENTETSNEWKTLDYLLAKQDGKTSQCTKGIKKTAEEFTIDLTHPGRKLKKVMITTGPLAGTQQFKLEPKEAWQKERPKQIIPTIKGGGKGTMTSATRRSKKSLEELQAAVANAKQKAPVASQYKHHRDPSTFYTIVGHAVCVDTQEVRITYQDDQGNVWSRLYSDFFSTVPLDNGATVAKFQRA